MRKLLPWLILLSFTSSCGWVIARRRGRRDFEREFGCAHADTSYWSEGNGWRYVGCATVAFYRCFPNPLGGPPPPREDGRRRTTVTMEHATLLEGAAVGMFAAGLSREKCGLDHYYYARPVIAPAADDEARAALAEVDRAFHRATVRFESGRLELWAPHAGKSYVLMRLFHDAPMMIEDYGGVTFQGDEGYVKPVAMVQTSETEAVFVLRREQLHALADGLVLAINDVEHVFEPDALRELDAR